jgi:hypothetical protein
MKRFNFYFQLVAVVTVAILYIWGMPGLVGHFFLGIVQLLTAIAILIQYRSWGQTIRNGIIVYWALVILTALSFYLILQLNLLGFWATGTMVFTGGIAIYFTWLSYQIMQGETRRRRRGNFSILDFPTD